MANDVGKAMSRLKHRDIRTRRRAVRTLFEANDPSTLKAFEVLLDDEDPWFVSKALDAYRLWAVDVGEAAVSTLLRHRSVDVRRAGANLLALPWVHKEWLCPWMPCRTTTSLCSKKQQGH